MIIDFFDVMEMDDEFINTLINNAGTGPTDIYDKETCEHFAYFREVYKKHDIRSGDYYAKVLTLGNIRFLLSSDFLPKQLYGYVNKAFIKYLKEAEKILLDKDKNEKKLLEANIAELIQTL